MIDTTAETPLVLIVEDDPDVRDTLSDVLQDEGYRTSQAGNGREALDTLRRADAERPAVVLLDIMMPVMDGVAFRNEQLRDASLRDIPVIVLSAHARLDELASELELTTALRKPVALDALLEAVERVVRPSQGA